MAGDIYGADEVERAVEKAIARFTALATHSMGRLLVALRSTMSPYPPQPSRTRGKSFNTYVRGIGTFPRSAFSAEEGAPGGYSVNRRKARGKIRFTSQQMDKRWKTYVVAHGDNVDGYLLNTASYSGLVVGHKDQTLEPHQLPYHAETGWPNQDDALEALTPNIDDEAGRLADEMLRLIGG